MLHRYLSALFLILTLFVTQIASVEHQAQHISDFGKSSQSNDKHSNSTLCEKCVHFSELGSGLNHPAPTVFTASFSPPIAYVAKPFFSTASIRTYSARAPPKLV